MSGDREMQAYCDECKAVRDHVSHEPGSTQCQACGHIQQMMVPLA